MGQVQAYGQDSTFQPTGGVAFSGLSYPLDQLDFRARKHIFPFQTRNQLIFLTLHYGYRATAAKYTLPIYGCHL